VATALDQESDPARLPLGAGEGGYVLCEGWMHPDGGIDRAIAVARAAGKRIVVVADVWEPSERSFFTGTIEPLLGADAVFVGDVHGQRRVDLLCRAEAVISATCWEPAVASMIEALACGTPVVAAADGAAAEFVDNGRTGYLCYDDAEMVNGLVRARRLDRGRCRSSVVPVIRAVDVVVLAEGLQDVA
jgi:glycosyltransferase involved in cell wall biosynthesis